MRILFVENRQQTRFWEMVARRLEQDGHQIYWIVQNLGFAPTMGKIFKIPYPANSDLRDCPAELQPIEAGDRNILHFGGDSRHYAYYDGHIRKVFDEVMPEICFGETTLFHESLCVRTCRLRGILYLQPHVARYPVGRFQFFQYDTQEPYRGSGETLSDADALEMANAIAGRTLKLMYLGNPEQSRLRVLLTNGIESAKVLVGRVRGERYNTPGLLRKLRLDRQLAKNRVAWERLAAAAPREPFAFNILYPMQMQPEANLDIWGQPYRKQAELLRRVLQHTDSGTGIMVKPNPHSKYELTQELLDLLASSPRLVVLPHASSMNDAMERAAMVLTVTGTVAYEAFCSGKPLVNLVNSFFCHISECCVFIPGISHISGFISRLKAGMLAPVTAAQKCEFLQHITRTSYVGDISNPVQVPGVASESNVSAVYRAFVDILKPAPAGEISPAPIELG